MTTNTTLAATGVAGTARPVRDVEPLPDAETMINRARLADSAATEQPSPAQGTMRAVIVRGGKTVAVGENGEAFAIWDRELSAAEQESILTDPYQLYEQPSELDVEAERQRFEIVYPAPRTAIFDSASARYFGPNQFRDFINDYQAKWGVWLACARSATRRAATCTPAKSAPGEWISVADRLPPHYEEVVIWPHPTDYCMTAELYGLSASGNPVWKYGEYENGWGHSNVEMTRPVTHWMPKPQAPDQSIIAGSAREGGEHAPSKVAESSPVGADKEST